MAPANCSLRVRLKGDTLFMDTLKTWLSDNFSGSSGNLLSALLMLVLGLALIRGLMLLLRKALEKSRLERAAHSLIYSLTRVVLYILLGLIVASGLGIDVTGVVALASVLTLAVSLALQNILANIIGGFTILSTQPFHSGDYVEIAGQSGTVEEINMTYTRLATPDRKQISIPNSAVVAAQVVNYSTAEIRRVELTVSASRDTPVAQVLEALLEAGNVEDVLADPAPQAVVTAYEDSAIRYSLRLWTRNETYWDVYFRVSRQLQEILNRHDIKAPSLRQTVHLDR